ncbi:MAG: sulfite exporter TauE/SafE family protein [Hyphomicrobiales bacterium]
MEHVDLVGLFMLGLLGTGHCLGMCGPLIFVFPGRTGRFMPHVWYHLGRVTTYAAVGGILGGVGAGLAALTGMNTPADAAPLQAGLRLIAAALLTLLGLIRLGWVREPRWLDRLSLERIPGFQRAMDGLEHSGGASIFFAQGLMLGLLPCGLSYGAFAQALGTAGAAAGTLLVLAFALGTAPGLLLLGTGVAAVVRRYRRQSDIIAGILMLAMGARLAAKAWAAI